MRRTHENMRKFCMRNRPLLYFAFVFILALPGFGQEFRAGISGEVADPSGAAVVAAKVVARSVERNVSYEAVTNSAGRYVIQFLPPGTYTITVEKEGFHKFVREGVA